MTREQENNEVMMIDWICIKWVNNHNGKSGSGNWKKFSQHEQSVKSAFCKHADKEFPDYHHSVVKESFPVGIDPNKLNDAEVK